MSNIPKKIKDYLNLSKGFITHFNYDFQFTDATKLDILFYTSYGERNPAPIITNILSESPTDAELKLLGEICLSMFSEKWNKMKNLCSIEYNPIYNYHDELIEHSLTEEVGKTNESNKGRDTDSNTVTRSDTRTDNLSTSGQKNETTTNNALTNDSVYGFNSSNSTGTDDSKVTETGVSSDTTTINNTGTQIHSITGSDTKEFVKDYTVVKDSNNSEKIDRNYIHSGNIGNLTTQQLIRQEIDLWEWKFSEMVLNDLKEFLTIPIYLS